MSNNTEEKNTCSPSLTFFVNGKKVCFNFLFIWIKITNSNLHWTSVCDFIALSCNTLKFVIIFPHKRSLGQGYVFTPVCLSGGGDVMMSLPAIDSTTPWTAPSMDSTPPRQDLPPDQHHPKQHHPWTAPPPPGQHYPLPVNKRAVRMLLQCFLVSNCLDWRAKSWPKWYPFALLTVQTYPFIFTHWGIFRISR